MKPHIAIALLAFVFVPAISQAEEESLTEEVLEICEEIPELHDQIAELQDNYQSLTNQLNSLSLSLSKDFEDRVRTVIEGAKSQGTTLSSVPVSSPATTVYATSAELKQVSDKVNSLNSTVTALRNQVYSQSLDIGDLESAQTFLAEEIARLSNRTSDLDSKIGVVPGGPEKAATDNPSNLAVKSRLMPVLEMPASSFSVSEMCFLSSFELYCPAIADIIEPSGVCIIGEDREEHYPSSRTYGNSLVRYVFDSPVSLKPGKYYLCLKKFKAFYVCAKYRGEGMYKRYRSDELAEYNPDGGNASEPLFEPSFVYCDYEIWFRLYFRRAALEIGDTIVNFSSGNLTLDDRKVMTEANLAATLTQDQLLTYGMLSPALRGKLLTTDGGQTVMGDMTVEGRLTAGSVALNSPGAWKVGTPSAPCDLVINSEDGTIRSSTGALQLAASAGSSIKAKSFLALDGPGQSGVATISPNTRQVKIPIAGLTSGAVVLLTPLQDESGSYWYEADDGELTIRLSENASTEKSFSYVITKK